MNVLRLDIVKCRTFIDRLPMTNFGNANHVHIEKVWGGPCDSHNCNGDAVAFISISFTDGGSVGGYFCRTHLNQYEVAYGLPRTTTYR